MVYPHVQHLGPAHAATPHQDTTARELDSRSSDGIYVRLLWNPADGHLSVAVNDTKNGDAFELPVAERDRALDVFRHPYAYAAQRNRVTGRTAIAA